MTSYKRGGVWQQDQMGGYFGCKKRGEKEDWYQSGSSVWVKEVSRLVVALCGSCVSLSSVCVFRFIYTLELALDF